MEDNNGETPADIAVRFGFPGVATQCKGASAEKFKRERQIKPAANNILEEKQDDVGDKIESTRLRSQEMIHSTKMDEISKGTLGLNINLIEQFKNINWLLDNLSFIPFNKTSQMEKI